MPASTTETSDEPAFICTICWQPQHSTPQVLGSSSRIVCRPCWKAVLDLSICWVCGEFIVRGDEVVSLGWCFWHRGCFGCLVCGTRLSLPDTKDLSAWGSAWDHWKGGHDGGKGGKRKGIELEHIPLCDNCDTEMKNESKENVLEKGLEMVSKYDGGMSRDRLDMMTHEEDQRRASRTRWRTSGKFKGSSGLERDLTKFINGDSGSRHSAEECEPDHQARSCNEVGRARATDEPAEHAANHPAANSPDEQSEPPNVYLSILDPLGSPPFMPSRMKPLPKWMSFLPSNRQNTKFQQRTASNSNPPQLDHSQLTQFPPMPTDKYATRSPVETSLAVEIPLSTDVSRRRRTISIDTTPVKDYSISYTDRRRSRSRTVGSEADPIPRRRTPYPDGRRSSSKRRSRKGKSRVSTSLPPELTIVTSVTADHLSTLPPPIIAPPDIPRPSITHIQQPIPQRSGSCVSSSEYLDKYHPISPNSKYQKYVPGRREPILEKIKRQKVGEQSIAKVAEDAMANRGVEKNVKLGVEEHGLDPRRDDLQKELRNLFNEE